MLIMIGNFQLVIIAAILAIPILVVTIMALIDIIRQKFSGNGKILWMFVVLLFNIVGAILYFALKRGQRLHIESKD